MPDINSIDESTANTITTHLEDVCDAVKDELDELGVLVLQHFYQGLDHALLDRIPCLRGE